jgi:PPM family protein phosphatase
MHAPGHLITPLEPAAPQGRRVVAQAAAVAQHSLHTTAFRRIEAAVATSCGSQHESNEDAHSALAHPGQLFVVADGVGGGAMAQLASRELVSHLHAELGAGPLDAGRVRAAMLGADRSIAQRIAQVTDAPGAATVALCAPVNLFGSKWLLGWVGDCRVYRFVMSQPPSFEMLTRDDTFRHLEELPPAGGTPDDPARMVGNGAISDANVGLHELACGDLLVLCSDGVHKYVRADDWVRVLAQPLPLTQRCEGLIALARANGSTDDATVLLLQRARYVMPRPRWMTRWVESDDKNRTSR